MFGDTSLLLLVVLLAATFAILCSQQRSHVKQTSIGVKIVRHGPHAVINPFSADK